MRGTTRILTAGLLCLPLALQATGAARGGDVRVDCRTAPGTDAALASALCTALRAADPPGPLRVEVLAAGPGLVSARLARPDGPWGPRLDLSLMDRGATPDDLDQFARDLLQFGLPA